jgi:Protein of unknown function (DUF3995)
MAFLVAIVLVCISGLHAYWAFGGRWGSDVVVPQIGGKRTFTPSPAATMFVAVALLIAALIVLAEADTVRLGALEPLVHLGAVMLGIVFVARAIGEFRYVGFFKRVRGTPFADLDTRLFSPLCLALGAATLWVAFA